VNRMTRNTYSFCMEARFWEGVDMTGEKAQVPIGLVRILPETAGEYAESGYIIRHGATLNCGDRQITATVIDIEATYQKYLEEERTGHDRFRKRHEMHRARWSGERPAATHVPANTDSASGAQA
jgi:hypothetical protein